MSTRMLSLAAAAALALGAFAGSPASAAAIAPTAPSAQTADVAPLAAPVNYRQKRSHYRRYGYGHHRPHHFGHFPRFGFSLHFGGYPRHYSSCWRTQYVWTSWGYQPRRVWVCGRW